MNPLFIRKVDSNQIFLRSSKQSITFGDLFGYQQVLKAQITVGSPLILIEGHNSPNVVQLIAACWLNGFPFYMVSPDSVKISLPDISLVTHYYSDGAQDLSGILPHAEQLSVPDDIEPLKNADFTDFPRELHFASLMTSGTTGAPKRILLRRRQIYHAIAASLYNFYPQPGQFWLLNLPLYHMGGLNVVMRSVLVGSGIHIPDKTDISSLLTEIDNFEDINYISLVPTQLSRMLDAELKQYSSQFDGILIGGGPSSPDLIIKSKKAGLKIVPSYGMTETCGQIIAQNVSSLQCPPESSGNVLSGNQIRIMDTDGKKLPEGSSGIIQLKGPQIPNPEDLPDSFAKDGWLVTGDFGRVDEQGFVYIESRRTDLIVSGGKNIRPFEVETLIDEHPSVLESAVIGVPDEEWGQIATAIVVVDVDVDKIVSEKEIKSRLKKSLPSWKIPKKWIFRDTPLPKTELGKIKKSGLSNS